MRCSHPEPWRHRRRQLVSPLGSHGRPQLRLRPGGQEGHRRSSWCVLPPPHLSSSSFAIHMSLPWLPSFKIHNVPLSPGCGWWFFSGPLWSHATSKRLVADEFLSWAPPPATGEYEHLYMEISNQPSPSLLSLARETGNKNGTSAAERV